MLATLPWAQRTFLTLFCDSPTVVGAVTTHLVGFIPRFELPFPRAHFMHIRMTEVLIWYSYVTYLACSTPIGFSFGVFPQPFAHTRFNMDTVSVVQAITSFLHIAHHVKLHLAFCHRIHLTY